MVSATTHHAPCDGRGLKVAVVRSRFNDLVTGRLLAGALEALRANGVADGDVAVIEVPGAVELAPAARLAVQELGVDAVVCLGAVIRGETDHYEHVCRIAADSIARACESTGKPVAFGVLTCDKLEQALARSGKGGGNRGADAALAALEMANLARLLAGRTAGGARS
jgi:6,7-dimethyl-8-ribityllumazine synthase